MSKNIYYDPEAFGLKVVGELEAGASYEFDTLVVWATEDGRVCWAEDAGCSCPTPFEGESLESVRWVTSGTWSVFEKAVQLHGLDYKSDDYTDPLGAAKVDLLSKVAKLVPIS